VYPLTKWGFCQKKSEQKGTKYEMTRYFKEIFAGKTPCKQQTKKETGNDAFNEVHDMLANPNPNPTPTWFLSSTATYRLPTANKHKLFFYLPFGPGVT